MLPKSIRYILCDKSISQGSFTYRNFLNLFTHIPTAVQTEDSIYTFAQRVLCFVFPLCCCSESARSADEQILNTLS